MEVLLVVVALLFALALLGVRFGADSRPRLVSEEERLAHWGVTWELGGWQIEERRREVMQARRLGQLRSSLSTGPTARARLAAALRSLAARLDDDRESVCDGPLCEFPQSV